MDVEKVCNVLIKTSQRLESCVIPRFAEWRTDGQIDRSIPKDDVAADWLATKYRLPEKSARSMLNVIKANIKDFGLTQVVSGKTLIASRDAALEDMATVPAAGGEAASVDEAVSVTASETGNGHQQVPTAAEAATV